MAEGEEGPCFIFKLPETIIIEIFLNLTVSALLHCRRVCKPWRHLLSSPLFAQCFQSRGAPQTLALCNSNNQFFLLQGDDFTLIATSRTNQGSNPSYLHFINSCNGLVCMSWCSRKDCSPRFPRCRGKIIIIVNPVSGEFIALPRASKRKVMIFCGFGFCPETNQFKVLRVVADRDDDDWSDYNPDSDEEPLKLTQKELLSIMCEDDFGDDYWSGSRYRGLGFNPLDDYDDFTATGWNSDSDDNLSSDRDEPYNNLVVEVYTLGTGTWRKIEVEKGLVEDVGIYADECYSFSYANGCLYWIQETCGDCDVGSFNFRNERFQMVTEEDEGERREPILGVGVFKGYPCLCRLEEPNYIETGDSDWEYEEESNNGIEVFVLKSKKKSKKKSKQPWTSLNVVRFPEDFSICEGTVRVIKYFENGDVLLRKGDCGQWSLQQQASLYMFNKDEQSVKRIPDYNIASPDDVVVFTPSFISLKDVVQGECSSVHKLGFAKVLKGKQVVRSQE